MEFSKKAARWMAGATGPAPVEPASLDSRGSAVAPASGIQSSKPAAPKQSNVRSGGQPPAVRPPCAVLNREKATGEPGPGALSYSTPLHEPRTACACAAGRGRRPTSLS
eukprot:COSAG01_NODE_11998_length_1818_cov_18.933682_2_plen_109_part_00